MMTAKPLSRSTATASRPNSHARYRADIDGLRALAVLCVVGFHAFPSWVGGGFVGVDIFFVISGYLISSIVLVDVQSGRFSFLNFYNRRVRRIFPALVVVMSSSLISGWLLLYPSEYEQLARHIIGGVTFRSNFVLLKESGYFDTLAETKPMLHLWSLAIEEQFYIIWPAVLLLTLRFRLPLFAVIAAIGVLSFSQGIYLSTTRPTAGFYLPTSRAWELMSGGLVAYVAGSTPEMFDSRINLRSIVGAALLVSSLIVIDRHQIFPGWWALLPTLGACLIISAGDSAHINRLVLSNKILVWIGLISYPLYLWHWPLLSFARVLTGMPPTPDQALALIALSFALAWVTYRLLERAARASRRMEVAPMLIFCFGVLGFASSYVVAKRGAFDRAVERQLDSPVTIRAFEGSTRGDGSCAEKNGLAPLPEEICVSNSQRPSVLFIGDSHAMALYSAIYAHMISIEALLISGHACNLYPNLTYVPTYEHTYGNNCTAIAQKAVDVATSLESIDTIVITNYVPYLTEAADQASRSFLGNVPVTSSQACMLGEGALIESLLKTGKRVVFVVDVPHLYYSPRDCTSRISYVSARNKCEPTISEHLRIRKRYMADVFALAARHPHLVVFDTTDAFCENGTCASRSGEHSLYMDADHISSTASLMLLSRMRDEGYFRDRAK